MEVELHRYNCGDFSKKDSLGVVCRGASLRHIEKYKKHFKNTFVVGQHVKSFNMIGDSFKGCNLVKVWGSNFHKPCKIEREQCRKYNIRDLQSTLDPTKSDRKAYKYKKIKKRYDGILETFPMPKNMRDRNSRILHKRKHGNGKLNHPTLGIFSVDLASAYKPKEIHIIGLDFYCADYLVQEKLHAGLTTNVKRAPNMIEFFQLLCAEDKDIKYYLYTCCDKIKSNGNLKVISL